MSQILGIVASSRPSGPSPLAGYYAWYDASDTTTISLNGNKVTEWRDKSANAKHLANNVDANRPDSGTRTINSKNAIDFNAANQSLFASTPADWTFINNSTGSTMFIVHRFDSLSPRNFMLNTGDNPETNNSMYFTALTTTGNVDHIVGRSTAVPNITILNRPGSGWAANTNYYSSVISDNSNATAANRSKVFINNGSALASNTYTGTPATGNPPRGLTVSAYFDQSTSTFVEGMNGLVGEVIIYQGVLSQTDVDTVRTYLATKWGI
jgi:hypothetical protein